MSAYDPVCSIVHGELNRRHALQLAFRLWKAGIIIKKQEMVMYKVMARSIQNLHLIYCPDGNELDDYGQEEVAYAISTILATSGIQNFRMWKQACCKFPQQEVYDKAIRSAVKYDEYIHFFGMQLWDKL